MQYFLHVKHILNTINLNQLIKHMTNQEIQEKLRVLSGQSAYPSISIFLPVQSEYRFTHEEPEHVLKLLIQETNRRLSEVEDDELLQTMRQKLDTIAGTVKFDNGNKGVGIFVSPEHEEVIALPFPVERNVYVGDNFQVRDLVSAGGRLDEYLVLLLSEKKILTLRGAGPQLSVIEVPDMPSDKSDTGFVAGNALATDEIITDQIDTSIERDTPSLDAAGDQRAHPDQSSIWGVRNDEKTRNFMVRIDNAMGKYLDQEGLRVVLVGVDKALGHFNKFSKNTGKILGTVTGNYDFAPTEKIAELVWPVVQNKVAEEKENLLSELEESIGRNLYESGIVSIWRAAIEGRIRTLIVEDNYQIPAVLMEDGYTLALEVPDNYTGPGQVLNDAIDDVIEKVLATAGKVVFVEDGKLAKHQQIAAITRY